MSDKNELFNEVDGANDGNYNETGSPSEENFNEDSNSGMGNFNETDGSDDEDFREVNAVTEGNFNEVDEANGENFKESVDSDDGNFNEVDNVSQDSGEGNFNEVGNVAETNAGISGSYDASADNNTYSAGGYQASSPQKNSVPKALIGVVVALALVIVGLIIFLVISIANKNKQDPSSNAEPTKIQSDVIVDAVPDVTGTSSNDSSSDVTGQESEDSDSSGTAVQNTDNGTEVPKFNVTVTLGQYKGVEVDYDLPEVTEEDVQGAVDYFASTLEEKQTITDRPVAVGDVIVIDFVGTIDGEVFDGGSATGLEYNLGSNLLIPGFEDGIIGKNVGDSVSLDLQFPDTYDDADLAGKPVNFLVNINEAYNYVTPELTDELVAENSEYETIAEYRDAARAELEEQAVEYAESKAKNDIIQKIIENCTFGGQIEEQIAYEENDCIEYYDSICMAQFGVDGATYFGYLWGITEQEYLAMVSEESATSVKYNAILDEIVKQENLTVSDEEYEKMFQETFIDYYGFESKEKVYEQITEATAKETVNGYVLHDKAEAIIFDSAIINK